MQIGLYSFAENTPDLLNGGKLQSPAERLRDLLEEIELADQLGLDFYGLGEHHRPDFVATAPVTILAAAAAHVRYGLTLPGYNVPPSQGDTHRNKCLEALALYG